MTRLPFTSSSSDGVDVPMPRPVLVSHMRVMPLMVKAMVPSLSVSVTLTDESPCVMADVATSR